MGLVLSLLVASRESLLGFCRAGAAAGASAGAMSARPRARDLATGRFEADMSRVPDVTRKPPFGTPVVRVRGSFCLPFRAGDPRDTAP